MLQRARAHRGEGETGRRHQAFLGSGDRDVHTPVVHAEIHRAERCDDVGHQQSGVAARVEGAANRGNVARYRGRGVGLHREHRLDAMPAIDAQPLLDPIEVERASPVAVRLLDHGTEIRCELAPGPGEHAGGRSEDEVALADQVRQRRFPCAVPVGSVDEYPAVGSEHLCEVVEARIGDVDEVGVHVVDGGAVHRGEHSVGDVGGPRGHQEVAATQEVRVTHVVRFRCDGGWIRAMRGPGSRTPAGGGLYIHDSGLYSDGDA